MVYALYLLEILLFNQLGIRAEYNSNSVDMNHAWSVIKSKNRSGKYLMDSI